MKSLTRYLPLLALLLAMAAITSCQDDFDGREPSFEIPVAGHKANMSILDLKKMYWHDGAIDNDYLNYCDTIGFLPGTEDEHIYIAGRVISDDRDGNVFKSLVIQDETAALAISINQYDLYLQYRPGQEIVIDLTGMYIGKYRGTLQLGLPSWSESRGCYETSFMPIDFFRMHAELNGLPEPEKIDTITFNSFAEFSSATNPDVLMKYQSQLVRFNNVSFEGADGTTTFGAYKVSGTDRNIVDTSDAKMVLRTSGYSTFWNTPLPKGRHDVTAILGYYANNESSAAYQLMLNNLAGISDMPTVPKGLDIDNPYVVPEVIDMEMAGKNGNGWVTGYIVGAVKPEVETTVSSSDDIEWTADVTLANTIVIAPTADTRDITKCLILPLTMDTKLRQYGNLVDNPSNYQKQIWLRGSFQKYMDAWGITCQGTADDFKIDGVTVPGGGGTGNKGDGSEANPYSVAQIIALNPTSTTVAVESGVWAEGYIVGFIPTGGSSTVISGTVFSADGAIASNLVLAPTADCTDYSKCITIQLTSGSDTRKALNLMDNPGMLGAHVAIQGDVMKYCGAPGIKAPTAYKLLSGAPDIPDIPDIPGGFGTETSPLSVAQAIAAYVEGQSNEAWIEGWIVGTYPSAARDSATFGLDNASNTNLMLAPAADCTDATLCIPVQLPAGDLRTALSLKANPGNLGKHVKLKGNIEKYFLGAGLKSTSVYSFY